MKVKFKLLELMATKNIRTVAELKRRSGISRPVLYDILNGTRDNFSFDIIVRLCDFFDCEIGDLVELKRTSEG